MFKGKRLATILFLALAAFATSPAYAAEQGGYLGLSLGESDDDILNETDSGLKLYGGVNLSQNLGIEFAYVDLGEFANGIFEQDGLSFQVVGYLPLTQTFDFFGKIGFFAWEVRAFGLSDSGTDLTYGFGGQVNINEQLAIRGEWETFKDISGGDVDLLSIGLNIRF